VPVVIINGLAAIPFMIGYVLFGVAMIRTAALPRWSGLLVAVRSHLLGFGIAQLSRPPPGRSRSSAACLGAGLGWASCRLWQTPTAAIETVRRGGMVSLSGAYGGIAIPCR
jgi:hypothetical protein